MTREELLELIQSDEEIQRAIKDAVDSENYRADARFVGHKFELTDENYLGFDGDVLLHQYTCKHCGRHDYLHPSKDKNKDWNGGKGDGHLCPILLQK